MIDISQDSCRNLLLRSIRADDFNLLRPDLQRVELELDNVLNSAGNPIEAVYFLEAGIVTFSELKPGLRVGIGSVGYDGMTGGLSCSVPGRRRTR